MDRAEREGLAALGDQPLAQFRRSSAKVMSGSVSIARIKRSACASIRPERRSPPRGFGAVRPVRRYSSIQRTALAMLTPCRRGPRHPGFDRPDCPDAKVRGKILSHACWPPSQHAV